MSLTAQHTSGPVAVLGGTVRQPEMRLRFERSAVHASSGMNLTEWVKKAPRRHWDKAAGEWVITAFGGTETEHFGTKNMKAKDPERVLRKAGFTVIVEHDDLDPSLRDVVSLDELVAPVCRVSKDKPSIARVRPRFAGWDVGRFILGDAARWDREKQWFEVPLTELLQHGEPKAGLIIEPATLAAAREALLRTPEFGHSTHDDETLLGDAAMLAMSTGIDLAQEQEGQIDRLVEVVGDIPDWFGMTPFPYQRLGAIAACAGRNFIADPTGLGKTMQAIGVMAIKDIDRAIVVAPPVVLTNWVREIEKCGLAVTPPPPPKKSTAKRAAKKVAAAVGVAVGVGKPRTASLATASGREAVPNGSSGHGLEDPLAPPSTAGRSDSDQAIVTADGVVAHLRDPDSAVGPGAGQAVAPRHVVMLKAGRKEPDFPDRGVIVVPDSLIASRPELRAKIAQWNPGVLIYDEAHRSRTWKSGRSTAMRDLCDSLRTDALRVPMTATPLFSNPIELVPLLAMSGHLDWVFGGYSAFVSRYCKRDHFNRIVAKKEMLPELRSILEEKVWVRRKKDEVLKDLPKVSRNANFVDVDLTGFKAAHNEVIEKICLWLDAFLVDTENNPSGDYPDEETVSVYSKTQIGLMSPLRKAAGVAKVPVALDMVTDWIRDEVEFLDDGAVYCDRPLLLWAHHQEVVDALVEHAAKSLNDTEKNLVGVIAGGTSQKRLNHYVDEFQAGRLPILILSITAAGVGITLTKGSDQIFIESTFSVPEVSQAIDRQNRIGQTRPVMVTTLIATDTLDQRLQRILNDKSEIIDAITGGGGTDVTVMEDDDFDEMVAPSKIIAALVEHAIEKHKKDAKAGRRSFASAA